MAIISLSSIKNKFRIYLDLLKITTPEPLSGLEFKISLFKLLFEITARFIGPRGATFLFFILLFH